MAALVFEKVTLYVGDKVFLKKVDFAVEEGETLVVAGNPGCGKSLILRAALGFPGMGDGERVEMEGEIYIYGRALTQLRSHELQQLRMRLGSVMRGGGLIDNMDVRSNITLPLYYHYQDQMKDVDIEDRCTTLLVDMGLGYLNDQSRRPVALNREERVYVGLARALINQPGLLLIDDPPVGLGQAAMAKLKMFLFYEPKFADGRDLGDGGGKPVTRVIATNDLKTYLDCGDRFAVLDEQELNVVGDRRAALHSDDPLVREMLALDEAATVETG